MRINRFVLGIFCLVCFNVALNAQTEKGKILLGGGTKLSFSMVNNLTKTDNSSNENGKVSNFELSPQIGFFISDGLALGAELPANYNLVKYSGDNKITTSSIAIAPFLRYYLGSESIKPFLQGKVGFGIMNQNSDLTFGLSDKLSASLFLYELKGGVGFFLNERVSLDLTIGYSSYSIKPRENNSSNERQIQRGIGLGIGVAVFL